jgi:hypothetical protein
MPSKKELAIRAKWQWHHVEFVCPQSERAAMCERLQALLALKYQSIRLLLQGDDRQCYTSLIAGFGSTETEHPGAARFQITFGPGVRHLLGEGLLPHELIEAAERFARERFEHGPEGIVTCRI